MADSIQAVPVHVICLYLGTFLLFIIYWIYLLITEIYSQSYVSGIHHHQHWINLIKLKCLFPGFHSFNKGSCLFLLTNRIQDDHPSKNPVQNRHTMSYVNFHLFNLYHYKLSSSALPLPSQAKSILLECRCRSIKLWTIIWIRVVRKRLHNPNTSNSVQQPFHNQSKLNNSIYLFLWVEIHEGCIM